MKKLIILFFIFLVFIANAYSVKVKSKFNPISGDFDFILKVSSTSIGEFVDISTDNATNGQALIFNSATGVFEPGSAVAGVTSLPLPANATNYLLRQSTGMTYGLNNSSFTISQATVTSINVTSIRWPDGTVQVSSPTGGGVGGSTDLTPLHTSTANLTNSINALNTSTAVFTTNIANLHTSTGNISASVSALNSSTSTLTTNVNNLHTSTSNISLSVTALNASTATLTQGVNGFLLFRPTASAFIDEFNLFKTTSASRLDEWTLFKTTAAAKIEKSNLFESTASVRINDLSISTANNKASIDAINIATGTRFISNQNSLQSGATIFLSSGNITTLIVNQIRWQDGTVQVSSPIDTQGVGGSGVVATDTVTWSGRHTFNDVVTISTGFRVTGTTFYFPKSDGSANQILQTDGLGHLSFVTNSGGSGVVATDTVTWSGSHTFTSPVSLSTNNFSINGSSLTFQSDQLAIGQPGASSDGYLRVFDWKNIAGTLATFRTDRAGQNMGVSIRNGGSGGTYSSLDFFTGSTFRGFIRAYDSGLQIGNPQSNALTLITNNTTRATIAATGQFAIGTSAGSSALDVNAGSVTIRGTSSGISVSTYTVNGYSLFYSSNSASRLDGYVIVAGSGTLAISDTMNIDLSVFGNIYYPIVTEIASDAEANQLNIQSVSQTGFVVKNKSASNAKDFNWWAFKRPN